MYPLVKMAAKSPDVSVTKGIINRSDHSNFVLRAKQPMQSIYKKRMLYICTCVRIIIIIIIIMMLMIIMMMMMMMMMVVVVVVVVVVMMMMIIIIKIVMLMMILLLMIMIINYDI